MSWPHKDTPRWQVYAFYAAELAIVATIVITLLPDDLTEAARHAMAAPAIRDLDI